MRAGNEVRALADAVVLELEVAHGDGRHVVAQRLPVVAVVIRHPHLHVGAGVEHALLPRILANGVRRGAAGDAGVDLRPRLAAVVRAPEVRVLVIQAQRIGRDVRRELVKVPGVHVVDARERLHGRRRHVGPLRAAIHGHLDVAVVGAGPQHADVLGRRSQRGDGANRRWLHGACILAGAGRHVPRLPGEVRADARPRPASVERLPDDVRCVEQQVAVHRRPDQWHGAHVAVVRLAVGTARRNVGSDLRGLSRLSIVERDALPRAAEHHVGIARIGSGHAVFLDVHRVPVVERDLPVHGAAFDARRAGVLLAGADAVGKVKVRRHVIHRRRRLRVPVAPRESAVGRDHRALVGDGEDDVGVARVDPHALVVVTAGRAAYGRPIDAAVLGAPHHRGRAVHHVLVLAVHRERRQVAATDAPLRARVGYTHVLAVGAGHRQRPVLAAILRLVEAHRARGAVGARRCNHCIEQLRIARRNGDVRLQHVRQAVGQLLPRRAAVGGLEDPVAAAAKSAAFPERLLLLPQRGVHGVGIAWVNAHVVAARVLVAVQHLLERRAAIRRAEDAAFGVGSVRMPECGDEQPVRVARIHVDHRNHPAVEQPEVRPGLAGVGRLVDAVAGGEVGTNDPGARAHVDHAGVGRGNSDCANGARALLVEQRQPVGTVVRGAPDAAVVESDVGHVGLRRHAGDRAAATGAAGANLPPLHGGRGSGRLRRREGRDGHQCERGGGTTGAENAHGIHLGAMHGKCSGAGPIGQPQKMQQRSYARQIQGVGSWIPRKRWDCPATSPPRAYTRAPCGPSAGSGRNTRRAGRPWHTVRPGH